MAQRSPTVCQRELGKRLRELRHSRGLTVEEVAHQLLCSAPKISRVETGARRPTLRDVRDLCGVYEVDSVTSAELMELAREARQPGWWTQYSDLEDASLIGLEQEATSITCYAMFFLPTLLQTEAYARATIKGTAPKIDLDTLEQRVDARLRRQARLAYDQPPRYEAILDEAVLYRQVGGSAVMRDQFDRILKLVSEVSVTVQVIPFWVGAYSARDSNFDYMEFGGSSLSDVVFVEGLVRHLYVDRTVDLERYREAVEYLRDVALTPQESTKRIREVRDEFAGALL